MKIFNPLVFTTVFISITRNHSCLGFKSVTSSTKSIRTFHNTPFMSAMDEVNAGNMLIF